MTLFWTSGDILPLIFKSIRNLSCVYFIKCLWSAQRVTSAHLLAANRVFHKHTKLAILASEALLCGIRL